MKINNCMSNTLNSLCTLIFLKLVAREYINIYVEKERFQYFIINKLHTFFCFMQVACLDEFPRPIPSKVILKLQSRVLQIDCCFPYLTVCTLAAVFLCDLEKEDFTRVQCTKNTDIRSTGLCLMILPERSSARDLARERTIPSAKLILFIGEAGARTIHCCNMEGNIQHSKQVQVSTKVSKYSMPLFDPTKAAEIVAKNGAERNTTTEEDERVNISLGKMLCTDDGMIVSVSSDRLYVYDPYTLNVIAWNEDFKRINNFKIISNYAFIWAGNKLEVVAFTAFRSYAEQLFRAKLIGVLENWIVHTVHSLGWRTPAVPDGGEPSSLPSLMDSTINPDVEDESPSSSIGSNCGATTINENVEKAVGNIKKMMLCEGEEESEFTQFVIKQLPFPLILTRPASSTESVHGEDPSTLELEAIKTLEKPVRRFLKEVHSALLLLPSLTPGDSSSSSTSDNHLPGTNNDHARIATVLSYILKKCGQADYFQAFSQVWKALLVFYEEIDCTLPQLDYKKSELTLTHVLHAAQSFLSQPKLVNLQQEISDISETSRFEDVVVLMICCMYCQQDQFKKCASELLSTKPTTATPVTAASVPPASNNSFTLCFTKFAQCPVVKQWFRELGTSPETLFYDGLLADTLLLLLPFVSSPGKTDAVLLTTCLDSIGIYDKLTKYFMTWLFLCRFIYKPKQVPYSPLLRSMLNDQLFEKLAEEMFSTIYRDFRLSSFGNAAHYLHHFISALVLLSKSPGCGQPRNVSVLLTCFPLMNWAREDIVTKIIAACHLNQALLGLYLKACLEDGNSLKLCACGIQAGYGLLEDKISSWQRAIEEAIIKLLLEEYFKSSPYDDDEEEGPCSYHEPDGNGNDTQKRRAEMLVHMFAMRRGLLEPYFRSPLADEFLSEELQAELIIRSGSCASLKYYQCKEQNMSLLLKCYENHFLQNSKSPLVKSPRIPERDSRKTKPKNITKVLSNNQSHVRNDKVRKPPQVSDGLDASNHGVNEGAKKCANCSFPLHSFKRNFKPLSRDCLGLWALKQVGNLERLIEIIQNCQLNVQKVFSAR